MDRNLAPYFQKKIGDGTPMAIATKASTELPQPYPRLSYRVGAKSGKANPAKLRRKVIAATALAAYFVYASIT